MKFALTSALLLVSMGAVVAQDTSSSSVSSSAPASTMAPSSSSSMPASSSSGGSMSAAAAAATCSLVSGDPREQPFGCVEGATTVTPAYDSTSLQSFQIGKYTAGREGEPIESVATDMAETVIGLYPTLTVAFSDIVEQYVTALEASISSYVDGAVVNVNVPSGLGYMAAVAVAAVAGGAFVL